MQIIILFIIIYFITFLIDYIILKKLKKYKLNEDEYIKKRFKIKFKKDKSFKLKTSLINAFIMTITCVIVIISKLPLIITIPMAFMLLMILIFTIYGIYGKILRSKENEKKETKISRKKQK